MSTGPVPPSWKLPKGVNASLWQYAHTPRLAEDEDAYFFGHPLFSADRRAVDERFRDPAPLVDLGCGAGRMSLHFARKGFAVTAVELSRAMLVKVTEKARREGLHVQGVRANLCDLRCVPAGTFQYALSMFSTLGMIRGAAARRRALREAYRVLKPGGMLALHAHNILLNMREPQGRIWLLGQLWRTLLHSSDYGDRRMTYRGIPAMEVHLYRWGELRRELRSAGFQIDEVLPIHSITAQRIVAPWLLPGWRAGGWIVFASKR